MQSLFAFYCAAKADSGEEVQEATASFLHKMTGDDGSVGCLDACDSMGLAGCYGGPVCD